MGHDISGINKAGKEIAYARFSMWNSNAAILYSVFDALEYHAGVSGNGRSSTFSLQQVDKASKNFDQIYPTSQERIESMPLDHQQIFNFIMNCLETAKKEGNVKIYFG
jgi:hypothetical protein